MIIKKNWRSIVLIAVCSVFSASLAAEVQLSGGYNCKRDPKTGQGGYGFVFFPDSRFVQLNFYDDDFILMAGQYLLKGSDIQWRMNSMKMYRTSVFTKTEANGKVIESFIHLHEVGKDSIVIEGKGNYIDGVKQKSKIEVPERCFRDNDLVKKVNQIVPISAYGPPMYQLPTQQVKIAPTSEPRTSVTRRPEASSSEKAVPLKLESQQILGSDPSGQTINAEKSVTFKEKTVVEKPHYLSGNWQGTYACGPSLGHAASQRPKSFAMPVKLEVVHNRATMIRESSISPAYTEIISGRVTPFRQLTLSGNTVARDNENVRWSSNFEGHFSEPDARTFEAIGFQKNGNGEKTRECKISLSRQ